MDAEVTANIGMRNRIALGDELDNLIAVGWLAQANARATEAPAAKARTVDTGTFT